MADLTFPNFGVPFPFQNYTDQLQASMGGIPQGYYARWGQSAPPPSLDQGWVPHMQAPTPTISPGAGFPAVAPGASLFQGANNVNPAGYTGTPTSPTTPAPNVPPPGAQPPVTNSTMPQPKIAQANAPGGLLGGLSGAQTSQPNNMYMFGTPSSPNGWNNTNGQINVNSLTPDDINFARQWMARGGGSGSSAVLSLLNGNNINNTLNDYAGDGANFNASNYHGQLLNAYHQWLPQFQQWAAKQTGGAQGPWYTNPLGV